jgi:hypothetical protein
VAVIGGVDLEPRAGGQAGELALARELGRSAAAPERIAAEPEK